jgi:hypothetical protein
VYDAGDAAVSIGRLTAELREEPVAQSSYAVSLKKIFALNSKNPG